MHVPGRPTVFLHIGVAKTGTTYLQALLWHNRRRLERHGLLYPATGPGEHFHASVDLRQRPFAGEHQTWVPGAWDAVAARAAAAPDRAVISHETLTRTHDEQVRRAAASLSSTDLHVVITVRDLARQVPAVWQEHVKNRGVVGFDRFLEDVVERPRSNRYRFFWEAQDVLGVLERWSAAVPAERIHVVTVPQPGALPGLLWQRFASVMGVDPAVVDTDVPLSNVSLGVAEAELLRQLNPALRKRLDWTAYEREVKSGLAERLAARPGSIRLSLPVERREWAAERADQIVAGIEKAGYDVVGDLDELRPVFDDRPVVMPGDIPQKMLMQIAGEYVGDMLAPSAPTRGRAAALAARLAPSPGTRSGRALRRARHALRRD